MPRLTISLPEEFGAGSETGRAIPKTTRREVELGRRTDGSGELEPIIVRWFATWAGGGPFGNGRLR